MRSIRLLAVAVLAVVLAASMLCPVHGDAGMPITVTKITTNGDTTTVFHFTLSFRGYQLVGAADLTGGTSSSFDVVSGTYTLEETVPPGWVLRDISCSITVLTDDVVGSFGVMSYRVSESSAQADLAHHSVTIQYVEPDEVVCTFTNDPAAPVGGVILPANFAIVAPWLALIGLVGCIGTVVVVAKKRSL